MTVDWKGVLPAVTTPWNEDLSVDHGFLAAHARWLVESGSAGFVPCGSLGEGATLTGDEKRAVLATCVASGVPVIAGVAALSTAEAVRFARDAKAIGCHGLMVLPPYVYSSDWREMKTHVAAVMAA